MSFKRVSNKEVPALVSARDIFQTNHKTIYSVFLLSDDDDRHLAIYVVFSYGPHFPMYIYDYHTRQWYGNTDKYSVTTSRHQNLARPPHVDQWFNNATMNKIINARGLTNAVAKRMAA